MADRLVEPFAVAQLVEQYADTQLRDVAQYSNRELMDESGVHDLHSLAAQIYALGFNEGRSVEGWRKSEERRRAREAAND